MCTMCADGHLYLLDCCMYSTFSSVTCSGLMMPCNRRKCRIHTSKYLMDTIDFNKHDIDIFINLAKIVRYGRHWDESCNEWRLLLIIYFDGNFPYAIWCPYDDYKNMSTLNTYCGILSTCHNYKKFISWLISLYRRDQRLRNQNKNSLIHWLACNM
jgi:hypothetical protein